MTDLAARALALLRQLVECASVTPASAGALELVEQELSQAGFICERLSVGPVENLWATHGRGAPGMVLCGHVDVVPPGAEQAWSHAPFTPTEVDGKLYGRGTTDMKGGVAALTVAATEFVAAQPDHPGTLALALTTDEEGIAIDGIRHVVKTISERGLAFEYGLVGEPSSSERFGDTLRVGRRGSLTATITVTGKQGHVAYPQRSDNPIPVLARVIAALSARQFESLSGDVEPTLLQVVNVAADAGAVNVVPGTATAMVNIRHTPQDEATGLRSWVAEVCAACGMECSVTWQEGSPPYFTGAQSRIGEVMTEVATQVNGFAPQPSVGGGTSDGRFLIDLCAEVVEFGSIGATMHQVDEHIVIAELAPLIEIYSQTLSRLLCASDKAS